MPASDTTDDLMLRWEEARQQGRELTAEMLCAECPQRTEELRGRIRAVLAMERVLGVTDPDPNRTMIGAPDGADGEVLPVIPGYEIVRIIDQGGMGVVYEARQLDLGRTVAVKMISGVRLRPKTVARFRVEAEAAARLQHPNVVQIFHVGEVNGRPFFTMEYVHGGTLAEHLTRQPLAARQAAGMVETLARAAHAAHERGIIHRDLKPSNIMLTADGLPKIADFGLAKRLDDDSNHTHTGEILGTPSYMAPEQAEGKKDQIGTHTDVYALGAILYELLAGKPPFQGSTPLHSLRLVMTQEPVPPSRLVVTVPRDLEAICLKCLEKAPGQRYVSALALAEDLRRFLSGQPVIARHIGPLQRGWKLIRRHPLAVALVLALTLLVVIPIALRLSHYHNQQQIRARAVEQAPQVREILKRNCHECHGQDPANVQKNLNILNHQQLIDSDRRIVVPGEPEGFRSWLRRLIGYREEPTGDHSRLMQRIEDGSMPPEEEEERLPRVSEKELAILRDWIRGGAPPLPEPDPKHPVESAVPYSEIAAKAKTVFQDNCYECHRYDVAKGGIKILHHRLLVTVRKVVVPGDPEKSELFELLIAPDKNRMPPAKDGPRLTPAEIATVRQWIEAGAPPFPKSE